MDFCPSILDDSLVRECISKEIEAARERRPPVDGSFADVVIPAD
jgi:hypothetical protein